MKLLSINVKKIEDLKQYIHDDKLLNLAITKLSDDIDNFRLENYSILREMAYPSVGELGDAIVKNNTQQYINKCLSVKERFPKP